MFKVAPRRTFRMVLSEFSGCFRVEEAPDDRADVVEESERC
jgi:hypothetical protein